MKGRKLGRIIVDNAICDDDYDELNKIVADNGSDGGKPNESPNAITNQKHHSLLLQMLPTHAGCKPGDRDGCMVIIRGADVSLEDERGARMVALFDHEEARTTSAQGARSPIMFDALNLISTFFSSNPQALLDVSLEDERGARMVALFDHEEARTTSTQGARSPIMFDALNLISTFFSSNPQSYYCWFKITAVGEKVNAAESLLVVSTEVNAN
ncbi:probable aspartyl aminopeptidase [Tanacetum coccineum]